MPLRANHSQSRAPGAYTCTQGSEKPPPGVNAFAMTQQIVQTGLRFPAPLRRQEPGAQRFQDRVACGRSRSGGPAITSARVRQKPADTTCRPAARVTSSMAVSRSWTFLQADRSGVVTKTKTGEHTVPETGSAVCGTSASPPSFPSRPPVKEHQEAAARGVSGPKHGDLLEKPWLVVSNKASRNNLLGLSSSLPGRRRGVGVSSSRTRGAFCESHTHQDSAPPRTAIWSRGSLRSGCRAAGFRPNWWP